MMSRILAGTSILVFAVLSVLEIGWGARVESERLDAPETLEIALEVLPSSRSEVAPPFVSMTYNVRLALPLVPGPAWFLRRDRVVRVVREAAPDLLAIQEDLVHQRRDLIRALPDYDVVGEGSYGGNVGEFDSIFYLRSRFERVESGSYWLSDTPHRRGSISWGNAFPRVVTWVHLRDRLAPGHEFHVQNVHLPNDHPSSRRLAAQLIRRDVAQRIREGYPVVLLGDLNARPGEGAHRILSQFPFRDTFDLVQGARDHGTWHDWTGSTVVERIDHVLVAGAAEVASWEVVVGPRTPPYPSDHFPVVVRMSLQQWVRPSGD